jgi:tyrosine-protein phosphatase SIW14
MVKRLVFSGLLCKLCKTFCAALLVLVVVCPSPAQIAANTPTQPVLARASFGAPAEKLKLMGVHNAGKVSDALLRGAQPSAQGLAELKKLGVTTIVDLRGNSGPVAWERAQQDPAQKIFVHCYYGEDRTGVMVAAYRIAQHNWTADQAITEMDSFGFHYYLYRAMKSYVRKFPSTYGEDPIFAPLHTATAQR